MGKLEDMRVGDWVRWDSMDLEVTDRDSWRLSADYSETQWELGPELGKPYYLVRSLEKKAGGTEEVWVCTRQTEIGAVQYRNPSGEWRNFNEKDYLQFTPDRVRSGETEYAFNGETTRRAQDDEGDTVDKLTWDYFDQSRRRNLVIEVWKEPDADYYEAYAGGVVRVPDFTLLPPRASARHSYGAGSGVLNYAIAAAFAAFFFVPLGGGIINLFDVGAEYLLAVLLPAAVVSFSFLKGAHRGLLAVSLALSAGAAALLLRSRGLGGSYWEYAVYGLLTGPAIAEAASKMFGGIRSYDKTASACNATLLLLFIISFAHYIETAPRPHNFSGLLAACALPLLPALVIFLAYTFKGGSDEPA